MPLESFDGGWVFHEAADGSGYEGWLYHFADGEMADELGRLYEYDASGAIIEATPAPALQDERATDASSDPGWVFHEDGDGSGYQGWLYHYANGITVDELGRAYEYDDSVADFEATPAPALEDERAADASSDLAGCSTRLGMERLRGVALPFRRRHHGRARPVLRVRRLRRDHRGHPLGVWGQS